MRCPFVLSPAVPLVYRVFCVYVLILRTCMYVCVRVRVCVCVCACVCVCVLAMCPLVLTQHYNRPVPRARSRASMTNVETPQPRPTAAQGSNISAHTTCFPDVLSVVALKPKLAGLCTLYAARFL